jgi:hypothetical protein
VDLVQLEPLDSRFRNMTERLSSSEDNLVKKILKGILFFDIEGSLRTAVLTFQEEKLYDNH